MARRLETSEIQRKVELRSGGTMVLSAVVDVARLSPSDRAFIFDLFDRMAEYEAKGTTVAKAAPAGQVTP